MNDSLLKKKVLGETLRAYDQLIRGWVNDQLKASGLDPLLTVSDADLHSVLNFREALGKDESEALPASIRFRNTKIFYTKDSLESSIDFNDDILWVTWESATEEHGRFLKFFGEDFRSITFSYASTEEGLSTDSKLYLVATPTTVEQDIGKLSVRLDAVEAGFGSVDIPEWIGQVMTADSSNNIKNVNEINSLIWPDQDFSSRIGHSAIVFFGKTSGLRLMTKKPGDSSETVVVRIFVDEFARLRVRYDDLGAWIDINSLDGQYSFRSLDDNQEYFEYDPDDKLYRIVYSNFPTTSEVSSMIDTSTADSVTEARVQEIVNTATADSITEARVQEMIDSSVGAAIADSY